MEYEKQIKESGLKKGYIAKRLGITGITLRNKLSGKTQFTKAEKYMLDAILRGEKVE